MSNVASRTWQNVSWPRLSTVILKDVESNKLLDNKSKDLGFTLSEDIDQTGQIPSLIRVFNVNSAGNKGLSFLTADSRDSDQAEQI